MSGKRTEVALHERGSVRSTADGKEENAGGQPFAVSYDVDYGKPDQRGGRKDRPPEGDTLVLTKTCRKKQAN